MWDEEALSPPFLPSDIDCYDNFQIQQNITSNINRTQKGQKQKLVEYLHFLSTVLGLSPEIFGRALMKTFSTVDFQMHPLETGNQKLKNVQTKYLIGTIQVLQYRKNLSKVTKRFFLITYVDSHLLNFKTRKKN